MVDALAYWVVAPGCGELRAESLPVVGAGDVHVETLFSAVSRGTEALVFHGRVPRSEWARMRAPHQAGDFPAPVKYGYSSVGRVLQGPENLQGRLVFCLYPHQSEYVVPADAVIPLPSDVPAQRAVLAANLETALNAVWDARPLIGDRVTVVGGGSVGALITYLACRQVAVDVELVDIDPKRECVAHAFGARFATPETARGERDLLFHASASDAGLELALQLARPEASLLELSWFGDRPVALNLGADFHVKRLKLCASQVGTVSPHARARFTHRARLELALSLCADPLLDVLFERDVAFRDLPDVMSRILDRASRALCQRVRYQ